MKALTACLYCEKKKECGASIKAHSFLDECFEAEDDGIRAALEDLRMLTKIALPVEIFEKCDGVAGALVELSEKQRKLCHYIAEENCEKYCLNSKMFCQAEVTCDECNDPCGCRDCREMSNFRLDWCSLE